MEIKRVLVWTLALELVLDCHPSKITTGFLVLPHLKNVLKGKSSGETAACIHSFHRLIYKFKSHFLALNWKYGVLELRGT